MSGMEIPMIIGIGSSVIGGVTSAAGSRMAGQEASRAAAFEQQQLQIQGEVAKINANQAEARRREELTANMETIAVLRAGRGIAGGSPTEAGIFESAIADGNRDIAIERFNYLSKADTARRASEMAGRKAKTSLLAGNLAAAGDIAQIGSRVAGIYAYPSTRRA
jgi:hypothetical protein